MPSMRQFLRYAQGFIEDRRAGIDFSWISKCRARQSSSVPGGRARYYRAPSLQVLEKLLRGR
jgi:hypothetical protein